MMSKKNDFYIGYVDEIAAPTKKKLKRTVLLFATILVLTAVVFSISQKPFDNSTFELTNETKISGIYHESPYPMLQVTIDEGSFKNIILLGFGKFGANAYLDKLKEQEGSLLNKQLSITGNLIYFNGKTLLQITNDQKITLEKKEKTTLKAPLLVGNFELEGEIVDPKCYFGVMKPGLGKIHRSCAVRCVSGGTPPVLVTTKGSFSQYFLLTNMKGESINNDILPYIGQPSRLKGVVEKLEDWYVMKIDISDIEKLNKKSTIY